MNRLLHGSLFCYSCWAALVESREATNGIEAIQLAEEFQLELILLDERMPKMRGREATRLIKARWPEIKVIAISIHLDYQGIALETGADAFVFKSDPPEKLREALAVVMQKK